MEEEILEQIIEVNISDRKISKAPFRLVTRGLGSCVGITFYDPVKKIGAMAHAMLPDINKAKLISNPLRFVNHVIKDTVGELEKNGCIKSRLEVKLFGGAHMFGFISNESVLNVGDKNVQMAKTVLEEIGIKIKVDETGGTFGRTIILDLQTGKVTLRTIAWGDKEV